jgi:hypothetical protein
MNNLKERLIDHYFKTIILDGDTIKLPPLNFDGISVLFKFGAEWKYPIGNGLMREFNLNSDNSEWVDYLQVILEFRIMAVISPLNMAVRVKKDLIDVQNAFVYEHTGYLWCLPGGMAEEAIQLYKELPVPDCKSMEIKPSFKQFLGNKYKNDIYHNMWKIIREFKILLPKLRFCSYTHMLVEPKDKPDVEKEHIILWKKAKDEEYNCECCVCNEDTRYKTDCGHNLCLICHMKLEKMADEDNEIKCPMCRNEYDILNWS